MQASTFKRSLVAAAIVSAFAVGAVTAERVATINPAVAPARPAATSVAPSIATAAALPDFPDLVAANGAAVVQISVTHDTTRTAAKRPRGMPDGDLKTR